jgi:hypothetical protein
LEIPEGAEDATEEMTMRRDLMLKKNCGNSYGPHKGCMNMQGASKCVDKYALPKYKQCLKSMMRNGPNGYLCSAREWKKVEFFMYGGKFTT